MTTWTGNELNKIGTAEELQIASIRNGGTLRKPVTIWVVRHGDDRYVRSVNRRTAAWFRGTQVRHEGHIRAGQVGSSEWLGAPRELDDQLRPFAVPFTCIPAALVHDSKPMRRNEVQ